MGESKLRCSHEKVAVTGRGVMNLHQRRIMINEFMQSGKVADKEGSDWWRLCRLRLSGTARVAVSKA